MNPLALCGVRLASIVAYGCMLQMIIDTVTAVSENHIHM